MSTQNKHSIDLHKQHISSTNISKASEDARLILFLRDEFFNTHESYLYNYTWSQLSSVEKNGCTIHSNLLIFGGMRVEVEIVSISSIHMVLT